MKLSKKRTATAMQSYNMMSCDEFENIQSKESFKMSRFSNPAEVDVSYFVFIQNVICFNKILS